MCGYKQTTPQMHGFSVKNIELPTTLLVFTSNLQVRKFELEYFARVLV